MENNRTSTERSRSVPQLRFSEFDEEWNIAQLGKITSYVDYRGRAPEKSDNGMFLVTAKNIRKGFIDYETSKEYVPSKNYNTVMSKGLPKIGDILFTTEAPLGNVCQVDNDKIALAQRVIKLRGNDGLSNDYLLHNMLSPSYQKMINRMAFGTTVLGISGKALRKTTIQFPTLQEQTKIANFLTATDKRINLLQKKKAQLEQYKKGIMQKLFSQTIRFKDEDGNGFPDWEEKQLGEVCIKMQSGISRKLSDTDIGFPILRSNNIINGVLSIAEIKYWKSTDDQGANLANYFLRNGDILVNFINSMAQIGKFAIFTDKLNRDTIFTTNIMRLAFNESINVKYIFYYFHLKEYRNYIQSITKPAVNQASFTTKEFNRFKLRIPSLLEQKKIASFLSAIDKQIEKVGQQIETSQQWKKGLLQKMFV